jgi:transposase
MVRISRTCRVPSARCSLGSRIPQATDENAERVAYEEQCRVEDQSKTVIPVFVPLTYRAGDLAEVDFFEVLVDVNGTRRKAWLFPMRLMHSGRDFAWIYERQDQISFLDGHVRAFAHFDCVPARAAYDNLRAAVVRILVGGARTLTPRFTAIASHDLLEACFCRPLARGAQCRAGLAA